MNNTRRKAISKLYNDLQDIITPLQDLLDIEQDAFYNIPDNLEGSERYERAEEAYTNLETAVDLINEALETLDLILEN